MTDKSRFVVWVGLLVLIAGFMGACAGFDMGDLVRVETPVQVQREKGLPKSLTFNQAQTEYEQWLSGVQATGAQWKGDLEDADYIVGALSQLGLQQLNELGPTLAGVPVLGPSSTVLLGIAGYAFGQRNKRKEKEKSYNAGLDKRNQFA